MLISYLAFHKQANPVSGNFDQISFHSGTPPRCRVEVRLSLQERSQLEALAHEAGMTLSRYVRNACFHDPALPVVTDVAIETYQQLGKIGDTLTQLQTDAETLQFLNDLLTLLHQVRAEIAGVCSTESGLHHQSVLKTSNHP